MAIVFEVYGSLAMFRRPYTTTSSVSFPIMPPTAAAGLIAAIIGLDNGSDQTAAQAQYWEALQGTQIAIELLKPVAWFSGTVNFWNVKEPQKNPHIQVKHQFLRQPGYRIHVSGPVELELKTYLEQGYFHYTPYLGTAYALAQIMYLEEYTPQKVGDESSSSSLPVSSLIPAGFEADRPVGIELDLEKTQGLFKELLPFQLDHTRALQKSIQVFYGKESGAKIYLKKWDGLEVSPYAGEYISWFPAW